MSKITKDEIKKEVDKVSTALKKAPDKIDLLDKVVNLNETNKVSKRLIDNCERDVNSRNASLVKLNADVAKELSYKMFLSTIKANYPQSVYDKFKNMGADNYINQMLDNATFATITDKTQNDSDTLVTIYNDGSEVQISPNMFFKNMTTVLNDVSIGKASLDLSTVFNAFDFYNDGWLTSGIAKMYTTEYAATGIIMLNQNQVIPMNYTVNGETVEGATQNIAGYQSSHPVFANMDYSAAGGGIGWGLFSRGNLTENVWKLSVTSPKQYAEMNLLFLQLMENSKQMSIWDICTHNLFSNVTNLILDNTNTNMRDCFINSLFPNIVRMRTPTQMFNLGDTVTITNSAANTSQVFQYGVTTDAELDAATSAVRTGTLNGNSYLNSGYNTNCNIMSVKDVDIHIVCTPTTYVNMFSGMLSVLYNYSFQSWDFYVPKENIHLIYKKPSINVSYLNPATGLSAHLQPVTMDDEWFSDENMLILTKPKDVNMWPATYGYVWDKVESQRFAAAQVETAYNHFLIYGGVTPYAQAFWYHAKGLLQPLANTPNPTTKNITYNTGVPVNF